MGFTETRQNITATVKEQTDIVKIIGEHIELKRSGVRYLGLCPFHGEKTPSFSVNGAEQFFYCFGCGESGDVFSFLMKYHNLDFSEALQQLADRLNIEIPQNKITEKERQAEELQAQMFEVTRKAASIYRKYLLQDANAKAARNYLEKRGIPEGTQGRFEIGYAPAKEYVGWDFLAKQLNHKEAKIAEQVGLLVKNDRGGRYDRFRDRVLFPIHDMRGRICGFGGRIIGEGQPKYMNSPESPIYNKSRNLLGLYQQSDDIRMMRKALVVEGNFDMISLVVHGAKNVVAPLGTAMTSSQIRLLGKYSQETTLLFDGDAAGKKAAMRSAPLFLAEEHHARVALLPTGHDPDTFVRENGMDELQRLVDEAKELPEFVVDELMEEHGMSLEGKRRIAEEIKPLIGAAQSQLQRSVVISHFAEKLNIDVTQLEQSLAGVMVQREAKEKKPQLMASRQVEAQPLSPVQKKLVEYMILHPQYFKELEERNIRQMLEGSVGEVLFLQVKNLISNRDEIEPEEILSALPEGAERKLVAQLLLEAPSIGEGEGEEANLEQMELKNILDWLELQSLRVRSKKLDGEIGAAQKDNDFELLQDLFVEKMNIEKKMREFRK